MRKRERRRVQCPHCRRRVESSVYTDNEGNRTRLTLSHRGCPEERWFAPVPLTRKDLEEEETR